MSEWRPRIVLDVDEALYLRVTDALPWGTRKYVLQKVVEQLVEAIEQEGQVVAYLIMNGQLRIFGRKKNEHTGPITTLGDQVNQRDGLSGGLGAGPQDPTESYNSEGGAEEGEDS